MLALVVLLMLNFMKNSLVKHSGEPTRINKNVSLTSGGVTSVL